MRGSSPFTILEQTFGLLSAEPYPLAIDGGQLGTGVPARQFPIGELRSIVVDPGASQDLKAAIIETVVSHLRQERATWVVVLGGLLLPAMRRLADQIPPCRGQAPAGHIEAELLSRLLLATRRPPPDTQRFAMRLLEHARE